MLLVWWMYLFLLTPTQTGLYSDNKDELDLDVMRWLQMGCWIVLQLIHVASLFSTWTVFFCKPMSCTNAALRGIGYVLNWIVFIFLLDSSCLSCCSDWYRALGVTGSQSKDLVYLSPAHHNMSIILKHKPQAILWSTHHQSARFRIRLSCYESFWKMFYVTVSCRLSFLIDCRDSRWQVLSSMRQPEGRSLEMLEKDRHIEEWDKCSVE